MRDELYTNIDKWSRNLITIAICDDNEKALIDLEKRLNSYLKNINLEAHIRKFQTGTELIEYAMVKAIDIVFLDIYMGPIDGIETAHKIREIYSNCKIIFVTSSLSHAVLSYEVKANDYLVKPVSNEKLYNVLKVAIENIETLNAKFIVVKNNNGIYKLLYKDILYVESNARILTVYTTNKKIINYYSKLNDFEEALNDLRFFRCHKSFLINLDHVHEAKDTYFIMENSEKISISSKFKKNKKIYMDYLMNKL